MVDIKARLVLVPEGGAVGGAGATGGLSAQEERNFKIEQLKANKSTNNLFASIAGFLLSPGGIIGAAIGAGQTVIPEMQEDAAAIVQDPFGTKARRAEKAAENSANALKELEDSAMSFEGGLQQMEDGSVNVVDEFGNVVSTFGEGTEQVKGAVTDFVGNTFTAAGTAFTLTTSLSTLQTTVDELTRKINEIPVSRLGRALGASGNLKVIDSAKDIFDRNPGAVPIPFGGDGMITSPIVNQQNISPIGQATINGQGQGFGR